MHPEVFVIGDLAGRDGLPGFAENAMQGGLHAAARILRDVGGQGRADYRYRGLGSAAYTSRGHALLQAGPVKLSGLLGWLGWGFIHIAFLTASATASAPRHVNARHCTRQPQRSLIHPGWIRPSRGALHVGTGSPPGPPLNAGQPELSPEAQ